MKSLSKDRLFFVIRIASLWFICLLFCITKIYATSFNAPPTSKQGDFNLSKIIIPSSNGEKNQAINIAPISGNTLPSGKKITNEKISVADNRHTGIDAPLRRYFQREVNNSKSLSNFHEENFIYANGQHSISYYNGVLTKIIKDFDGDGIPEMALFKIRTDSYDEFSGKEIIVEMIKSYGEEAVKVEEIVLGSSQFNAEEIDLSIAIKYIDGGWRIYLNTYEKNVRDNSFNNYFVAVEYQEAFNTIAKAEFYGVENVDDSDYEKINEIMDAGIDVRDDNEWQKRCFINDDRQVIPVFTIRRVNEKLREGYAEEFFEQLNMNTDIDEDLKKGRYGYTQFLDRTNGMND